MQLVLPSYFDPNMLGVRVDQRVFNNLVKQHLPHLHHHIESLDVDVGLVTFRWFMMMFVSVLPAPVTLRIWDAVFFFGGHVIFQVRGDPNGFVILVSEFHHESSFSTHTCVTMVIDYLRIVSHFTLYTLL